MRKQDAATGVMIEVPSEAPALGNFPFAGYWSNTYSQIPKAASQMLKMNQSDTRDALEAVTNLANGPYKITVESGLWKIGELMRLNSFVSVTGSGGDSLKVIRDESNGGRIELAVRVFEPMLKGASMQMKNKQATQQQASKLHADYMSKLEAMRRLTAEIHENEEGEIPNIPAMMTELHKLERIATSKRIEANTMLTAFQIAKQEFEHMKLMRVEIKEAEKAYLDASKKHSEASGMVRQGELTNNQALIQQYSQKVVEYGQLMASLKQRLQNLGLQIERGQSGSDTYTEGHLKDLEKDVKDRMALAEKYLKEATAYKKQLSKITEKQHKETVALMTMKEQAINLDQELERIKIQYEAALEAINSFTLDNDQELMRTWISHIRECYKEAQEYLFQNLRIAAADAISPTSSSRIDTTTQMELDEFYSAVNKISDSLDADEVELLEEIGRLGATRNYIPGSSRIMALRGMIYPSRVRAYRKMVEEILSQGKSSVQTGLQIGPLSIGTNDKLSEVKKLVSHLADSHFELGGV